MKISTLEKKVQTLFCLRKKFIIFHLTAYNFVVGGGQSPFFFCFFCTHPCSGGAFFAPLIFLQSKKKRMQKKRAKNEQKNRTALKNSNIEENEIKGKKHFGKTEISKRKK